MILSIVDVKFVKKIGTIPNQQKIPIENICEIWKKKMNKTYILHNFPEEELTDLIAQWIQQEMDKGILNSFREEEIPEENFQEFLKHLEEDEENNLPT